MIQSTQPTHSSRDHAALSTVALICLCLLVPPVARAETRDSAGAEAVPGAAADALEAAYQFALAKLLVEESAFREAQEAFERALELGGSDPYGVLEVAKFHYELAFLSRSAERRRQQLVRASEYSEEAVRLAPDNPDVLFQNAQIHFRLGEHQLASLNLAQETFERLRRMREGDVQVLMSLGQIYFMKRQPEKAADVLKEASSYLPNHRMVQSMLVEALFGAGRLDEVEDALAKLIVLDPANLEERLRLYEVRRQNGDFRGAAEALRDAPPEIQDDVRLRRALAQALHLSGDNDLALRLVDQLIEELPDPQDLRRLRVSILNSMARYHEAIAELRPLYEQADEAARRLQDSVLISRLFERVGRSEEAMEQLRQELSGTSGTSSIQLKLALAGTLERYGRPGEAIGMLEAEAAKAGPEDAAVFGLALAEVLDRADRVDEALDVLDRSAETIRHSGKEERLAGIELRRLQILTDRERWQELVALAPTLFEHDNAELSSAARRLQAEGLAELGRVDEALEMLDPSRTAAGDERLLLASRVEVLFDHGREQEALELLGRTVASGQADELFFAARLYQRAERFDPVVELMERLLSQEPDSLQALFLLASAHERRGTRQASIDTFRRLLDLEPDHAPTLNYLGYMWAEQGENLDEALDFILRAVALDPDNGAYVDSLGWVYFQLGSYDQARQHLEWAARLLPTDPTIFEHLGDLYLKLEKESRARDYYRQALELGGDNLEEVRHKLEILGGKGP